MNALKRIMWYFQGTINHDLHLYKSSTSGFTFYIGADWGGYPDTRRSTSGYCIFLEGNLISWSSKCQPTLSHSSVKAEYRGVANVVFESCWIWNLLLELHCLIHKATWCIAIILVQYLSLIIVFNINTLSILKWRFILFAKMLLVDKFLPFMLHLAIKFSIYSPKLFRTYCSRIF